MAHPRAKVPLSRKLVIGVLIGELVLGLALAVTIGALSSIALAEEYRQSTQDIASTVAAALLPVIADQQTDRAEAILESIVDSAALDDVNCIQILDSSGAVVLTYGEPEYCIVETGQTAAADPWSVLFSDRVVSQTIEAGGLEFATVNVGLSRPDIADVLTVPLASAAFVLVAMMLVSVPWTTWFVNREVLEPLQQLEEYASHIAEGDPSPRPGVRTSTEIDQLQLALETMAAQLGAQRDELKGSYERLEAAYVALEKAKADIERLARIKEDFVAVAAHEIRAPLSTISLHAETLRTGEVGTLDEDARRAVASIYAAASRLGSIAHDLMDAALLERGELPMRFEIVWLDEIVDEAVADADAEAKRRGMRIRAAEDLEETVIRGDAMRLRQVLDNLLSNALKYSPEGGDVVVSMRCEGEDAVLEVADNGIGIDASEASELFRLFGRVDFGDSRETAGLGLGLAISARIVDAHGGSITFRENVTSGGTVFSVRLPRRGGAQAISGRDVAISVAQEDQES